MGNYQLYGKLSQKARALLLRQEWLSGDRRDAFRFALEYEGNLEKLQDKVREIEKLMSDPSMISGPFAPGAGPRIAREGCLAGLNNAIELILIEGIRSSDDLHLRIETVLRRESWFITGKYDAFRYVQDCDADVTKLQLRVQEIEKLMPDPTPITWAMSPDADSPIYLRVICLV